MVRSRISAFLYFVFAWSLNSPLFAETPYPLRTAGRHIVDADGRPFLIKAVNWYGANLEGQVAHGLDKQPIDHIVGLVKAWGFNSVRLTYSNAMLHDTRPVEARLIAANPQFQGMTALEVFDRTVEALARGGIAVMLNNHSSSSEWCCNYDTNGLWYFDGKNGYQQTMDQFTNDWKMLAARYRHIPEVIAADLRNEVRTAKWGDTLLPSSPNWGKGDGNDWRRAAEWTGNRVLEVNPNLLIIVEGINWQGMLSFLGGWRPHLRPVASHPVSLIRPDKLVYAAHNYGYIGPKHNGDKKTSPGQTTYAEMDEESFRRAMDEEWGYLLREGSYYTAPVIISEFGVHRKNPSEQDRAWFERITRYLREHDVSFAYWPLNSEGYGLVNSDWSEISDDDWRAGYLRSILNNTIDNPRLPEQRVYALNIQQGDEALAPAFGDWLSGASKGLCAVGTRLNGLSQDHRGLCLDHKAKGAWDEDSGISVQAVHETADRPHTGGDWARGFSKYECPAGYMAAGFSKHHWGSSGLLCVESRVSLRNECHTLWFDRRDARASESGGDFASGSRKGQCSDSEYIAGMAQRNGKASALLCCSL